MARTLGSLTTEALHDDFDATKYGEIAERAIKEGIYDLARRIRLPSAEVTATITLVAGTRTYTLPTDMELLLALVDPVALEELLPADENEVRTVNQVARSTPTHYSIYGSTLTVHPTPAAAGSLTLMYLSAGAIPAGSVSDVTAVGDADYHLLVKYARSRLFAMEDDAQMSEFWNGEYERGLNLARAAVNRRIGNRNRQVPGMFARSVSPRFVRP